jgi:hypothetical protein
VRDLIAAWSARAASKALAHSYRKTYKAAPKGQSAAARRRRASSAAATAAVLAASGEGPAGGAPLPLSDNNVSVKAKKSK